MIRSGDLIAQGHGDWGSWSGFKTNMVRLFTRSSFSHVGIAWVVGGRVFLLEAVMPKVRIFPLSLAGDFYLLPMQAPWRGETEEFALSQIGVDYSQTDAMRAFFEPLEAGKVNECAAYVREVFALDGIDLGAMSRPDTVVQAALGLGATISYVTG